MDFCFPGLGGSCEMERTVFTFSLLWREKGGRMGEGDGMGWEGKGRDVP